jgi:hypothetical protein
MVLLLGLAGPAVAVVAIRAERDRQEREIEERRWATLREERIRAYATMARLTKTVEPEVEDPVPALAEAHSEIEMLTDDPQLRTRADVLLQLWIDVWQSVKKARNEGVENPYDVQEIKIKWNLMDGHRTTFIQLAKDETKPPRPRQQHP